MMQIMQERRLEMNRSSRNMSQASSETNNVIHLSDTRTQRRQSGTLTSNFVSTKQVLFVVCHLMLLLSPTGLSTSNINSIWLSGDAPSIDSKPVPNTASRRSDSEIVVAGDRAHIVDRSVDWSPSGNTKSASIGANNLLAAPSSLQPAIVSIDSTSSSPTTERPQILSRRRILTDSIPAPIESGGRHHNPHRRQDHGNFSDEASSLNHLWSANQTNAQVHFDEEHNHQNLEGHASSSGAPNRRLKETSSLSWGSDADQEQNELMRSPPPPQISGGNSSHYYEVPAVIENYPTGGYESNHSRPMVNNSDMQQPQQVSINEPPSNVHYLGDQDLQDRWASGPPNFNSLTIPGEEPLVIKTGSMDSHSKRSRISGPVYQQRLNDLSNNNNNQQHHSFSLSPRSNLAHPGHTTDDSSYNVDVSSWPAKITPSSEINLNNNRWPSSLSYGFAPHATAMDNGEHNTRPDASPQTTPPPTAYSQKPPASNQAGQQPIYYTVPGYNMPPISLIAPRTVQHPPKLMSNSPYLSSGAPSRRDIERKRQANAVLKSRHIAAGGSRTSSVQANSFLRNLPPILNYIRPTVVPAPSNRPGRKSLLGSLGSRFVGWSYTGQQPNRPESSFYEGGPRGDSDQQQALASLLSSSVQQNQLALPPSGDIVYLAPQSAQFRTRSRQPANLMRPHQQQMLSYPFSGNYQQSGSIQQPTVAPASSSLGNFYGTHQGDYGSSFYHPMSSARHQRRSPSMVGATNQLPHQTSFIPVVAVEVTKTSPAPKPMGDNQAVHADSDPGSEIEDYLETKIGARSRHNRRRPVSDDFGSSMAASGSITRDSPTRHSPFSGLAVRNNMLDPTPDRSAHNDQQVTTVKSAVFGYMPHQAEAPLVQAMSILPQLTSTSTGTRSASSTPNHLPAASDNYASHELQGTSNHQDYGHSFANVPAIDSNLLPISPVDEQPSLALQLQANNFVQNDIAHPFLSAATHGSANKNNYMASPSSLAVNHVKPIDVYPIHQTNPYHEYQFFPSGADLSGAQQVSGYLNPLLTKDGGANVFASASELNPFLAPMLFAANNPFAYTSARQSAGGPALGGGLAVEPDESDNGEDRPMKTSNALQNKGNKKRSSEFFANAGQLLLSALPLLLAPTLGLMFASSPNPVGKFHAPLGSSSSDPGRLHTGIPGTYINSLNSGMVSNASPAPHMFTPTPPGYNLSTTLRPSRDTSSNSLRPFTNTSATTASPPLRGYSNHSRSSNSTTQRPIAILMSTSSPPPFGPNGTSDDGLSTSDNSAASNLAPTNTLLLVSSPEGENATDSPLIDRMSLPHNNNANAHRNHYDFGHEGADFDTQYASLKRPSSSDPGGYHELVTTTRQPLIVFAPEYGTSNPASSATRNRYNYAEVLQDEESSLDVRRTSLSPVTRPNASSTADNSSSTRLYPVATLPPFRRRTVSLVTSNGNRTIVDSIDKYSGQLSPIQRTSLRFSDRARPAQNRSSGASEPAVSSAKATLATNSTHLTNNATGIIVGQNRPPDKSMLLDLAHRFRASNSTRTLRHLLRLKRSVAFQDSANSTRRARRVVKKVKRKRKLNLGGAKPPATSSTAGELLTSPTTDITSHSGAYDQLNSDASKSKSSHLITALVSHSDDSSDLVEDNELESRRKDTDYDDRTARKRSHNDTYEALSDSDYHDESDDPPFKRQRDRPIVAESGNYERDFRLGGRGRMPPQAASAPPIEVTSTKIKVYANASDLIREKTHHGRALNDRNLVLNEKTRKALAEFGTLLLKDTLQIAAPPGNNGTSLRRSRKEIRGRSKNSVPAGERYRTSDPNLRNHRFYQEHHTNSNYNPEGAYPTETTLYRATPPPPMRIHHHHDNRSLSDEDLQRRFRPNASETSADGDSYEPPRVPDRMNLVTEEQTPRMVSDERLSEGQQYPADVYNSTGPGERYKSSQEVSPVTRYNHFLATNGINANQSGHMNDSLDEPRYTGSNSTRRVEPLASAPSAYGDHPYSGANPNHYSSYYTGLNRYSGRDRPSDHEHDDFRNYSMHAHNQSYNGDRAHPSSPHYGPIHNYYDSPPPPSHSFHHSSPALPLSQRDYANVGPMGSGYGQPHRVASPTMLPHGSYAAAQQSQQKYSYPAPEMHYPLPPGEPVQPDDYPHHYGRHPGSHVSHEGHHAGGGGFGVRNPISHYDSPNRPSDDMPMHPISSASLAAASAEKNEAKTVNEYLKRVYFSDSDRDKLMASYLTCDGLLNDNDHCLERLSCEFSDPLNIEKANKLDRAVSSILLGHILINTYIPNSFKIRLKSASIYGYTQSGKCSRYVCHKLVKPSTGSGEH